MSKLSQVTKDTIPNKLVNLAECEELIQENKTEKVERDQEYIQHHIKVVKQKENKFYASLNLPHDVKSKLFKLSDVEFDGNNDGSEVVTKPGLVILQHPLDGNLIIHSQELNTKYKGKILEKKS